MKDLLLDALESQQPPCLEERVSLAVIYDNLLAQRQAMEVCSRLVQQLGEEFEFDTDCWSFEQVSQAGIAEEAASHAADADILIVAVAEAEQLPNSLKLWIEMWLARKTDWDTALVALTGVTPEPGTAPSAAQEYLKRIASEVGLSYFARQFNRPKELSISAMEALLERANTVTPLLEDILRPPQAVRWGINE
jgi:hypothetical protein